MAHTPVKPERIVATAAAALEASVTLPGAFQREGIEPFKGAKDDTINIKVEGVLPYRTYGWRNNRSTELIFDEYSERKEPVTFGDDIYSGVILTDEQRTMDFDGWAKLATKQGEAIGRGLNKKAADALEDAPYEVVVTLDQAKLRNSLLRLKQVFDKLLVPGARTIYTDTDLELMLLDDDKLASSSHISDSDADTALKEATLFKRYGFNFVRAQELTGGTSYGLTNGGMIFVTAAPSVPESAAFGASASVNGVALRWVRDFEIRKSQELSVFNAYHSFHVTKDPLVVLDGTTGQPKVTAANHFVRGVKIEVGNAYSVEVANTELTTFTGITSSDGLSDGA
ncbi:hypothetical protein [Nocardioides alkalitolerans]|uniref:hypothetical protein n=1 Tax=Nocardioides alkalitolerans TaxID=281714 RepID=UPI00041337C0|nr:hypothetical protein [Nocardioides alkalitolerans]